MSSEQSGDYRDVGGRVSFKSMQEQLSTTARMQEVESHTRAHGDKADDYRDVGGRITQEQLSTTTGMQEVE